MGSNGVDSTFLVQIEGLGGLFPVVHRVNLVGLTHKDDRVQHGFGFWVVAVTTAHTVWLPMVTLSFFYFEVAIH